MMMLILIQELVDEFLTETAVDKSGSIVTCISDTIDFLKCRSMIFYLVYSECYSDCYANMVMRIVDQLTAVKYCKIQGCK